MKNVHTDLLMVLANEKYTNMILVCMCVCMSENLYPARLKQKTSQSRRGLKQTETSSVPV